MLAIKFKDVLRATLSVFSGNEGWIGIDPQGFDYHIVVPVDVQIARGVMACNRPTDGTPFGGYAGWIYFRCPPYDAGNVDEKHLRYEQALKTAAELALFLTGRGIKARVEIFETTHKSDSDFQDPQQAGPDDLGSREKDPDLSVDKKIFRNTRALSFDPVPMRSSVGERSCKRPDKLPASLDCTVCGKSWTGVAEFLRDQALSFKKYRARAEDFRLGVYIFSHKCGASVELPVTRFARPSRPGKSLVGSHACPGLCYYENSLADCSAECEGSCYRRIAARLRDRNSVRCQEHLKVR